MTVILQRCALLAEPFLAPAYRLYLDAFEPTRRFAAQRHVMTHAEFMDVAADARVVKWLTLTEDGERVTGIGTVTRELSAVPLIEPEFFADRWPAEYAAGKLWYVPFMATDHTPGAFRRLLLACSQDARDAAGLVFMDFSDSRVESNVPGVAAKLLRNASPHLYTGEVDVQRFWMFGFDNAEKLLAEGAYDQ
jgi:hypothetical protein